MREAISITLVLVLVTVSAILVPSGTYARPSNTTDLSGPCDDTDSPRVTFSRVLDFIVAFNANSDHRNTNLVTFDLVLEVIAIFNGKYDGMDYPDSRTNSSLDIMFVNWQKESTNATVTLHCAERKGLPVVYNRTLTIDESTSEDDGHWLNIHTGSEDGEYVLVITTPNRTATKVVEPETNIVMDGSELDVSHPLGHYHYGVSITNNRTEIASCSDFIPEPPEPCSRPD